MIVPPLLVKTEVFVWMVLETTLVSASMVSPENIVKRISMSVSRAHVSTEQLARSMSTHLLALVLTASLVPAVKPTIKIALRALV